jgi:hypothetical protein
LKRVPGGDRELSRGLRRYVGFLGVPVRPDLHA